MKFEQVKIRQKFSVCDKDIGYFNDEGAFYSLDNCLKIDDEWFICLNIDRDCPYCESKFFITAFESSNIEVELITKCSNCKHFVDMGDDTFECDKLAIECEDSVDNECYFVEDPQTFSCSEFSERGDE